MEGHVKRVSLWKGVWLPTSLQPEIVGQIVEPILQLNESGVEEWLSTGSCM